MTNNGLITCKLDEILFPVEMNDNPRNTNPEYSKVVTGIINGVETDLNYCSDRYALVPNADIFPKVRQLLINNGLEITEKYMHLNYGRFYGEIIIENSQFAHRILGTSDVIKPMLKVQHSYNGLTKYQITFGYYRLVCANGLTVPVKELNAYNLSVTGKHTKAIQASMKQLDNTLQFFVVNSGQINAAITAKYETLAGNAITNVKDRIAEVLNVTLNLKEQKFESKNGEVNFSFPAYDTILTNLQSELHLYGGVTNDWLIYNAINRYIYSDKYVTPPEKRAEKDSKVLEFMLS